jgi:FAD/FMN-containing dehydrogenase
VFGNFKRVLETLNPCGDTVEVFNASKEADGVSIKKVTRRQFLCGSIAAAGSTFFVTNIAGIPIAATAKGAAKGAAEKIDIADLTRKFKFKGIVVSRGDADYPKYAFGELWNKLVPDRGPQVICVVSDEQDVVEAVKFAKERRLKVVVRGGGHNWTSPSLRNGGMMIDLSQLTKVISIDVAKKTGVFQPIISNRDAQKALNPKGLAYPTGHCPQVKISGYLLGGGMAWNQGVWGHGCESVEAIEMVTADGEMITASKDQNQDYYWAARGAGSGMFAVCVRFHLKLYDLPKAITGSTYWYRYEDLVEVSDWVGKVANKLHESVEFSEFIVEAPAKYQQQCKSSNGKIVLVTGTCFANTPEEARQKLAPLESCPLVSKVIDKSVNTPFTFEQLFDMSGGLWPGDLRNKVDALFYDCSPTGPMKVMADHFKKTPSKKTVYMFAVFTGKTLPPPIPKDMAFSMSGRLYGGAWTMWDNAADDKANIAWHEECQKITDPFVVGRYVGETDTTVHLDYPAKCFTKENWIKLAKLRKKYDPAGLFFDWKEGLT